MSLIRELKNHAINNQKYEFAAWVRDIEREAASYSNFEHEHEVPDDFIYRLINSRMSKLPDDEEVIGYVKRLLREHKLKKIFK